MPSDSDEDSDEGGEIEEDEPGEDEGVAQEAMDEDE